jgi:hypothetical protein
MNDQTEESLYEHAAALLLTPRPIIKKNKRYNVQPQPPPLVTRVTPEVSGQPYLTSERPAPCHGKKPPRPNSKRCRHSINDSNRKLFPADPYIPPTPIHGEEAFADSLATLLEGKDERLMSTIEYLKVIFITELTHYLNLPEMHKNQEHFPEYFIICFAKEVAKRYSNGMYPIGISLLLQDIIQTSIHACKYTEKTYCVISKMLQYLEEYITPIDASMLICMLQEFPIGHIHAAYYFATEEGKQKVIHELTEETKFKASIINQLRTYLSDKTFMECVINPPAGYETELYEARSRIHDARLSPWQDVFLHPIIRQPPP